MTAKTSVGLASTATAAAMLAGFLVVIVLMLAPETTDAQTVIIGKQKLPSVIVDHSILENRNNTSGQNHLQKSPISYGILPTDYHVKSDEKTIRLEGQPSNKIKSVHAEKRAPQQKGKLGRKAAKSNNNVPLHSGFKSNPKGSTINPRPKLQGKNRSADVVPNKVGQPQNPVEDVKTYLSPRQQFHIGFGTGSAILGNKEGATLDTIAASLKQRNSLRVQLLAYADRATGTLSQTRRLSLSRALAVRSHLINQGIRSTRIDVRALGNKYEDGIPDRVDVIVTR
ncbi:MAG: OmpA family protein [Pseudomonadota bacterium]|nr:OmpA family protein [Pseudomonadota bacterium]